MLFSQLIRLAFHLRRKLNQGRFKHTLAWNIFCLVALKLVMSATTRNQRPYESSFYRKSRNKNRDILQKIWPFVQPYISTMVDEIPKQTTRV
jgi:hypothetical protein